ncbi:MAG: DNA topoisomerase, partial [Defluviitaleaceae bacterium]|nr:DNA topoisomerase [Defluviitaleaceae bacterium]
FDISSLETGEQNILQLIIKRMLIAVAQKYIYDETKIVMSCYGYELAASGKKPVTEGFKDIQRLLKLKGSSQDNTQADAEDEQVFPQLTIGESIEISKAILTEKQTTSPKLHTEATLLTAMENAGTYIKDGSILKGIGIGTQATRAGIIKKLFDIGYCAEKKTGKTSYLEPTKLGLSCIRLLPPELYTPSVTADWEENTSRIINNSYTANQFMAELETFVTSLVQNVRDTTVEDINLSNKESIGSCVHCEIGEIQIGTTESKRTRKEVKFIYCTEKCGFVLYGDDNCFYNSTGRTLIESQFKKLIEKNSFEAKTKFKKKECFELQVSESGKACLTQKKKA